MKSFPIQAVPVTEENVQEFFEFSKNNFDYGKPQDEKIDELHRLLKKGALLYLVKNKSGEIVGTFVLRKVTSPIRFFGVPIDVRNTFHLFKVNISKKYSHQSNKSLAGGRFLTATLAFAERIAKQHGAKKLLVGIDPKNPNWNTRKMGLFKSPHGYKTNILLTLKRAVDHHYERFKTKITGKPQKNPRKITYLTKKL